MKLSWIEIICLFFLSIIVANIIARIIEYRQNIRILKKTQVLSHLNDHTIIKKKKIPVTILTGFLGSGKTTLLNYILSKKDIGYRIMILENEMGIISIDKTLLINKTNNIIVMENGCMCCQSNSKKGDEIERILDHLLHLSNNTEFDYLIIETSGLADPGPIIRIFLQLLPSSSRFILDGVITMIDSKIAYHSIFDNINNINNNNNATDLSNFPIEAQRQILYADVIVFNKIDLINKNQLNTLKDIIRNIHKDVKFLTCMNSILNINDILSIHTFDSKKFFSKIHDGLENNKMNTNQTEISALHTKNIDTIHLDVEGSIYIDRIELWTASLIKKYAKYSNIFRIKGILSIDHDDYAYILQCVLDTFTCTRGNLWKDIYDKDKTCNKKCTIIIIGKYLDERDILETFEECISTKHKKTKSQKHTR